ncbi:Reverse transcriptase domain [Trinorchestia longiramus]|nr:Reverse transcriptase domain [Trinorchestia longiramus]
MPNYPVGGPHATALEKAKIFSKHFRRHSPTTATTGSRESIRVNNANYFETEESREVPCLNMEELNSSLSALKNKAPGQNGVYDRFLQKLPLTWKKELLCVYNTSLYTGCVPPGWKWGIWLPILKPGKDPEQVSSYRPICLLSCIADSIRVGKHVKWLKNYLTGRTASVRLGAVQSEGAPITWGLPQGAVLNPLLFNIMLSDLPVADGVQLIIYADDITILSKGDTNRKSEQDPCPQCHLGVTFQISSQSMLHVEQHSMGKKQQMIMQEDLNAKYSGFTQIFTDGSKLSSGSTAPALFVPSLAQALYNSFSDYWRQNWFQLIESTGKDRFLAIHTESPATPVRREHPCSWVDCAISRLRLGHVGVAAHLHRFQLLESPLCRCGQVETEEHFLLNCGNYSEQRHPLKRWLQCLGLQFNLKNVLGVGDSSSRVQLRIIRVLAQFLSTVGRLEDL